MRTCFGGAIALSIIGALAGCSTPPASPADSGASPDASNDDAALRPDTGPHDGGSDTGQDAWLDANLPHDGGPTSCPDDDLGSALGTAVYTGRTSVATYRADACGFGEGPALRLLWTAPSTGSFVLDDNGSASSPYIAVYRGGCGGDFLRCDAGQPAHVAIDATVGTVYLILVEGLPDDLDGDFTLDIHAAPGRESDAGLCANGIDDDYDNYADCADDDCHDDPACTENCTNGIDDNGNGLVDCDDVNWCGGQPGCFETCDNGTDDDGDGLIDCADPNCEVFPACTTDMPCRGYICPGVAPMCIVCGTMPTCVRVGGSCP